MLYFGKAYLDCSTQGNLFQIVLQCAKPMHKWEVALSFQHHYHPSVNDKIRITRNQLVRLKRGLIKANVGVLSTISLYF